eukprot:366034-Chlamydomonas_euryale.AAC.6
MPVWQRRTMQAAGRPDLCCEGLAASATAARRAGAAAQGIFDVQQLKQQLRLEGGDGGVGHSQRPAWLQQMLRVDAPWQLEV